MSNIYLASITLASSIIVTVTATTPRHVFADGLIYHHVSTNVTDGRINIDNNRAERAIKPFVIGRKAWLFANTHGDADASAVLYSLVETAKANGLQPIDYLMRLFEQWLLINDTNDIDHLLPWNIELTH